MQANICDPPLTDKTVNLHRSELITRTKPVEIQDVSQRFHPPNEFGFFENTLGQVNLKLKLKPCDNPNKCHFVLVKFSLFLNRRKFNFQTSYTCSLTSSLAILSDKIDIKFLFSLLPEENNFHGTQ